MNETQGLSVGLIRGPDQNLWFPAFTDAAPLGAFQGNRAALYTACDAPSMDEQSTRIPVDVAVLAVNHDFYRAFSAGDYEAMSRVWAERAPVACIHPGLPALVGRTAVLASWRQVLRPASDWEMSGRSARAHVLGDCAFVTCLEASGGNPAHLVATNIFVIEDGDWRMVHHQAGPLSEPIAASPVPNRTSN